MSECTYVTLAQMIVDAVHECIDAVIGVNSDSSKHLLKSTCNRNQQWPLPNEGVAWYGYFPEDK